MKRHFRHLETAYATLPPSASTGGVNATREPHKANTTPLENLRDGNAVGFCNVPNNAEVKPVRTADTNNRSRTKRKSLVANDAERMRAACLIAAKSVSLWGPGGIGRKSPEIVRSEILAAINNTTLSPAPEAFACHPGENHASAI